jgi:hypothetical protein
MSSASRVTKPLINEVLLTDEGIVRKQVSVSEELPDQVILHALGDFN